MVESDTRFDLETAAAEAYALVWGSNKFPQLVGFKFYPNYERAEGILESELQSELRDENDQTERRLYLESINGLHDLDGAYGGGGKVDGKFLSVCVNYAVLMNRVENKLQGEMDQDTYKELLE